MARKRKDALLIGSDLARADWAAVLEMEEGRRVVWRIISASGLLLPNPAINSHALMAFNEGRKDLGRDVWEAVGVLDRNWIPLMMQSELNDQLQQEIADDHGHGTDPD